MLLVDAQVHVGLAKYRPVEDYLPQLEAAGVDQAVLVQYAGSTDNSYLRRCLQKYPGRFAGVATVDHDTRRAASQIAQLATLGAFRSVRIPAGARTPGPDPLAVWRALSSSGLVATVQGPFADVTDPAFAEVVAEVSGLPIMLEHLGCYRYGIDRDFESLVKLASRANVHTMWSCFYRFSATPYPYPDTWPYLAESLDAFGPKRILWSGDINRGDQGLGETDDDYLHAIDFITDRISDLSEEDRRCIWGLNAEELYGLQKA